MSNELAGTFEPDLAIADADPAEYDGLVRPGGTTNPDKLRTLVEAAVLSGKKLTSWPSLQTDIRNAGGDWHDAESVTCKENGWTLVTSRNPDDLSAFTAAAIHAFAG